MNKEDIENKLLEKYNELVNKYGSNKILWVSAIGNSIYNIEKSNDIKFLGCYIPDEEEFYISMPINNNELIDIRLLFYEIQNRKSKIIEMFLSPYKKINPEYEQILQNEFFENKELLFLSINNINVLIKLKNSIINIIKSSFISASNEKDLINILTRTEIQVLKNIIQEFEGQKEGNVIVNQLKDKYNISTTVFRTLFYKMKEYNVASIDSRGTKGTHVKFRNIKLLQDLLYKI